MHVAVAAAAVAPVGGGGGRFAAAADSNTLSNSSSLLAMHTNSGRNILSFTYIFVAPRIRTSFNIECSTIKCSTREFRSGFKVSWPGFLHFLLLCTHCASFLFFQRKKKCI